MSKFTAGRWVYLEEYIPEGITLNEKEYLIQSESREDVALVWTEANARLISAAPKMYERLKLLARLISRQAQGQLRDPIDPAIADSIYELLAKIDDEPIETMKYSSSFFQNRNCEYFPCHEVEDTERFSCLFCFCPLYHMEKCGGNYRILSNDIKDCSGCTLPHLHYDWVISMLKEAKRADKQS